ncbi:hypothetical protein LXA29_17825, partial [Erwinia amylovora]|nr:hypothetical protein [Erwinia amylovora]
PLMHGVRKPLLIINAHVDHCMKDDVIPDTALLPSNVVYQLTQHGGQVGVVGGTLRSPPVWLEDRIPQWLTTWLVHCGLVRGRRSSRR